MEIKQWGGGGEYTSYLLFWQNISLCYVECFQDPLKTFLLKAQLAEHYLQSKYYLNSECLVVLDTS